MEPLEPIDTQHLDLDVPVPRAPEVEQAIAAHDAAQRQRRKMALALTVLLLTLIALAFGGGYWFRDRQIATEREISADLARAREYREKARAAKPGDLTDWANATATVKQAQGRLAHGMAGNAITQEVDQLAQELQREQERRLLLTDLDELRLWTAFSVDGHSQSPKIAERYAKLFRAHGLDARRLDAEQIGERLRLLAAPEDQVAAALDDWAAHERDPAVLKRLHDLILHLDADPFRGEVRQTAVSGTREQLEELAAKADLDSLPAPSLLLLANALMSKGVPARAETVLRHLQRRFPSDCLINCKLGLFFLMRRPAAAEEAVRFLTAAAALRGDSSLVRNALGVALMQRGAREEAIREYREALHLDKDNAAAHSNLGIALMSKGDLDDAIQEFDEAIRVDKNHAEAHFHLGQLLRARGQYADALTELKRADELGSKVPGWALQTAPWVKTVEQLIALDARLPAILKGDDKPANADEQILLAKMCLQDKHLDAAAARFYADAFTAAPKLADDLANGHRYNAACAAALAAGGQGNDAAKLEDKERSRLRRQALAWLTADLALWAKQAERDDALARDRTLKMLRYWQQDKDLAGVRDAQDKLPDEERQAWRNLWDDVETLCNKVAPMKPMQVK